MAGTQSRYRGPWVVEQIWRDLLFAHWSFPAAELAPLMPAGLELDTFDGQAWVGVVVLRMTDVHFHWLPPLPWMRRLLQINVRTYVKRDGVSGVYFFSNDISDRFTVTLTRRWYGLPYHHSRMSQTNDGLTRHFAADRRPDGSPPAGLDVTYQPHGPITFAKPGSLMEWMTARYSLYVALPQNKLFRADIDHAPWPLQEATADFRTMTMLSSLGLDTKGAAPHLLYARRMPTRIWPPRRAG